MVSTVVPAYEDVTDDQEGRPALGVIVTEWNDVANDDSDIPTFLAAFQEYAPMWSSYFPWDTAMSSGTPGIQAFGDTTTEGSTLVDAMGGTVPANNPCSP